jgi:plastocyanin
MLRRAGLVAVIALMGATANVAAATQHDVSITSAGGFSFSPSHISAGFGDTVKWTNNTTVNHTSTSDVAGIWNSGTISPNGTYQRKFDDAGSFGFHCAIHSYMKGTVSVALHSSASSGAVGTLFTITVADSSAPAGWTHQVQKMKVGASWNAWKSSTGQSLTFKPKKKGTYEFRARLLKSGTTTASGYSPVLTITVS